MPDPELRLQSVIPLDLKPEHVRIALAPGRTPELEGEERAAWDRMREANPRFYDGPILAYQRFDRETNTVHTALNRYARLAIRAGEGIETGVTTLSVTGILVARDAFGIEHALLARRGMTTRIYGGLWEFAPSGGIDPPPTTEQLESGARLDGTDAWRQLLLELEEELDLPVAPDPGTIVGINTDNFAHSTDLIFRVDLVRPLEDLIAAQARSSGENWEYSETRWIALAELAAFEEQSPDEIIPPTRAVIRSLFAGG